jgi:hypothetical protein
MLQRRLAMLLLLSQASNLSCMRDSIEQTV